MDEIVNQVAQKTGLPHDQAKGAVDAVLSALKERLPAPLAAQIDGALSGHADLGKTAGDLAGGLGGMFGKH